VTELEKLTSQAASTPDRFRIEGKVALVVGGNKGLGQAMALALAAAWADVCVVARGPEGLEETAAAITRSIALPGKRPGMSVIWKAIWYRSSAAGPSNRPTMTLPTVYAACPNAITTRALPLRRGNPPCCSGSPPTLYTDSKVRTT